MHEEYYQSGELEFNEASFNLLEHEIADNEQKILLLELLAKFDAKEKEIANLMKEEKIKILENEKLVEKLKIKEKKKGDRSMEIIKINQRIDLLKKPLPTITIDSTKLKMECFVKGILMSVAIYFVIVLCTERNFGIINVIAKATNSNKFFLAIAIARFFFIIATFFLIGNSLKDIKSTLFYSVTAFAWVFICILIRLLIPSLTWNIETASSAGTKSLLFLLLIISNYISQTFSATLWYFGLLKFKQDRLPLELRESGNFKAILVRSLTVEGVTSMFIFFLFFIILGVGSFSNLPNLGQNMEIFLFGYCFPLLKAFVCSLSYGICMYLSELKGWSVEYTAKMTSAFSCAGVIATTLSQLFIVFRNANDYSYFLSQYLPHEIIKKMSWLTFHPFYLKTKMQVVDILSSSFGQILKKRDKVDPAGMNKNSRKKKLTAVVMSNIGATAGEIVGRQLGEDLCMILITIWMLPISQEYLFAQSYPLSSSSLPFPSYESVGVMIIGAAYGTETILTILCFLILQRVGIPLMANRQILELHVMSWGMYIFAISSMMLMLAATFIY